MVKKTIKKISTKKVQQVKIEKCQHTFDNHNLKLILFCAFFGIFGVHKFAEGKTWTGIIFILLDLTIVGILITGIWSFVDLIRLTIKDSNPKGNIIVGLVLICLSFFLYCTLPTTIPTEIQKQISIETINPVAESVNEEVLPEESLDSVKVDVKE